MIRRMVRTCLATAFLFALACGFTVGAVAAEPLKIGFCMSLTGPFAVSGKQALIAMKLWQDDINAKGGLLGRQVQFVYYDDQSNPANVSGIYTKLIDVDKVDLVVGPYGTVMTAPAMPIIIAHNMVMTSLVALNVNSHFHYPRYFAPAALGKDPVVDFSKGFFDSAMKLNPKPKTVALLAADQEFAAQNVKGAHQNAGAAGLQIVYNKTYPPSTVDFSPIVRAIQAANPDVLFVASYPADSLGMVRAMHEVGFAPEVFGGSMIGLQITNIQMQLGPLLNGVTAFAAWEPLPTMMFPGVMDMLKRYEAKAVGQGVDPLGYFLAPAAYAYVQVLGDAVTAVGSLDQGKIADYMHQHTFDTVSGKFTFNAEGDTVENRAIMVQYHNITGSTVDQFKDPAHITIVAPPDLATGGVIPYPKAMTN